MIISRVSVRSPSRLRLVLRALSLSKLRLHFHFLNQAHNRLESTLILATAGNVENHTVSLFLATSGIQFYLFPAVGVVPQEARQRQ